MSHPLSLCCGDAQVLNYDLLVLSSGLQDVASTRLAKLDYKVSIILFMVG